jgi:hypothetical protein
VGQRLSLEAFHYEEVDPVLTANIMEHTDVRVVQTGNGFGFAFETLLAGGIRRKMSRKNLDRNRAIEPRISGAIDFAHSTRAEWRKNFVGPLAACQRTTS